MCSGEATAPCVSFGGWGYEQPSSLNEVFIDGSERVGQRGSRSEPPRAEILKAEYILQSSGSYESVMMGPQWPRVGAGGWWHGNREWPSAGSWRISFSHMKSLLSLFLPLSRVLFHVFCSLYKIVLTKSLTGGKYQVQIL